LRRVDLLLAADPPDPEGGLFHSQQAAEKALNGFLTWHDVPFRRVHELDELGERCGGIDSSLAELMGRADALTKYAWRFRYPGAPYEPFRTFAA
jgi:HEPN domain-containing protein